jgi:phosphomannomutase
MKLIDATLRREVEEWIALDPDPITAGQLRYWLDHDNAEELKSVFAGFLQFGTAGLRGPIGPGPARMNRAVVSRAAAGIAEYLLQRGLSSVVIGRDARHMSEEFTIESAEIFSGAGLQVFVLPRPLPTPVLAFAVKHLGVDCGVMVTASHNPAADNGYKVYLGGTVDGINYNGSQLVSPTDGQISACIETKNQPLSRGKNWTVLGEDIVEHYVTQTALLGGEPNEIVAIYTAMHGVGTKTMQSVFATARYSSPILVAEQSEPDPDFPTVAFPNPEEPGAIDMSLVVASEHQADLVIANDPDADRCAVAIPEHGHWRMLTGDELGSVFAEYLATTRPEYFRDRCLANSIVSSSLLQKIAERHGIEFRETLTGFKWLAKIENLGFGYEEAIGYCVDPNTVNDKDGISAGLMLARIAGDLRSRGSSIAEYLQMISEKYGLHKTVQISIRVADLTVIDQVLNRLRNELPREIAGLKVLSCDDLLKPTGPLPPTNGLRFQLDNQVRVIVRPSGTEPKVKCYIEVVCESATQADRQRTEELIVTLTPALTGLFH